MVRPPFSKRNNDQSVQDFFVLRAGVPDGLLSSLVPFANDFLYNRSVYGSEPVHEMHASFARLTDRYLPDNAHDAAELFERDRDLLLDVVDFVLGTAVTNNSYSGPGRASALEAELVEARSAYTIGKDDDTSFTNASRES